MIEMAVIFCCLYLSYRVMRGPREKIFREKNGGNDFNNNDERLL